MSGDVVPFVAQDAGQSVVFAEGTDPRLAEGFTIIPNTLLRNPHLTFREKTVYAILLSYAWGKRVAWPSQQRMADDCGVSVDAVQDAIRGLVRKKLVQVERVQRDDGRRQLKGRNRYILALVPGLDDTASERHHDTASKRHRQQAKKPRNGATEEPTHDTASKRPEEYPLNKHNQEEEPSALQARRRGSDPSSSPAVSERQKETRKRKPTSDPKPNSVTLGLQDPEAHGVAKAIYDARLAAGHTEVSAPKARYLHRYAGAVYDMLHAPHPTLAADILAAILQAIESGRRTLTPAALPDIVTEYRQSAKTGRRNTNDGHNRGTGAGDNYTPAAVPFAPGVD